MKAFDFWKDNRTDQHYPLTPVELQERFRDWLPTKETAWLNHYNGERIIRHFIAIDEKGLSSVFEESQFPDISDLLHPVYLDHMEARDKEVKDI